MKPPAPPRRPAGAVRAGGRQAPRAAVRDGGPERAPRGADRGQDLVIADPDEDELEPELVDDGLIDGLGAGGDDAADRREPASGVRSLEPAWAARSAARRRVLWVRAGVTAGAAALVALVGWLVLLSPVLALDADEVNVDGGGTYVDAAAVVAVAAAREGTPLLRLDTGAVRDEVAAMPGVAEATVTRDLPRGLTVVVVPREPVAVVPQDAETVQLVGSDGVVVATTPTDQAPAGLPTLAVDMGIEGAGQAVSDVLAVLSDLPPDLLGQVASAGASGPGAVGLDLVDGSRVVWGSATENELKAAVLATLLQVGASHYDVSTPETPITS